MPHQATDPLLLLKVHKRKQELLAQKLLRPPTAVKGVNDPYVGSTGKKLVTLWNGCEPLGVGTHHTIHDLECYDWRALLQRCFDKLHLHMGPRCAVYTVFGVEVLTYQELLCMPSVSKPRSTSPKKASHSCEHDSLKARQYREAIRTHSDIVLIEKGRDFDEKLLPQELKKHIKAARREKREERKREEWQATSFSSGRQSPTANDGSKARSRSNSPSSPQKTDKNRAARSNFVKTSYGTGGVNERTHRIDYAQAPRSAAVAAKVKALLPSTSHLPTSPTRRPNSSMSFFPSYDLAASPSRQENVVQNGEPMRMTRPPSQQQQQQRAAPHVVNPRQRIEEAVIWESTVSLSNSKLLSMSASTPHDARSNSDTSSVMSFAQTSDTTESTTLAPLDRDLFDDRDRCPPILRHSAFDAMVARRVETLQESYSQASAGIDYANSAQKRTEERAFDDESPVDTSLEATRIFQDSKNATSVSIDNQSPVPKHRSKKKMFSIRTSNLKIDFPVGVVKNKLGEYIRVDGGELTGGSVACTKEGDLFKIEWVSKGIVHCRKLYRSTDPIILNILENNKKIVEKFGARQELPNTVHGLPIPLNLLTDECVEFPEDSLRPTTSFPYIFWMGKRKVMPTEGILASRSSLVFFSGGSFRQLNRPRASLRRASSVIQRSELAQLSRMDSIAGATRTLSEPVVPLSELNPENVALEPCAAHERTTFTIGNGCFCCGMLPVEEREELQNADGDALEQRVSFATEGGVTLIV